MLLFSPVKVTKNNRLLACAFALLLLSAMPMLRALGIPHSANDNQSIKAIPELVGTRYCYGEAEVYSAWLKLRMKYVNRKRGAVHLNRILGNATCPRVRRSRVINDILAEANDENRC